MAHDERGIWESDNVEILIETNQHSFYQITVAPSGMTADLDRVNGEINAEWEAGAEVATYIGKGYWSGEIRILIAEPGHQYPLHNMVGTKLTPELPWFFNIGRSIKMPNGTTELPSSLRRVNPVSRKWIISQRSIWASRQSIWKSHANKPTKRPVPRVSNN